MSVTRSQAARAKQQLRVRLLAARSAAGDDPVGDLARARHLLDAVGRPSPVAVYRSLTGEPGTSALLTAWAGPGLLAPVLRADLDLDWAAVADRWRPGLRGTWEPDSAPLGREAVAGCRLVVVPALAVDRRGRRLGRGGGSYDRALARLGPSTTVVALLRADELLDDLPAEPHDRRVHLVATEQGVVHLPA